MTERGARYAFWPGTGPAGATCKGCKHYTVTQQSDLATRGYCAKAARYRNTKPIPIPSSTAACKYHEAAPRIPPRGPDGTRARAA